MNVKRSTDPAPTDDVPKLPLRRRWWLNVALMLLVAALAFFVWYRTSTTEPDTRAPLTAVSPVTIQRIEVSQPTSPAVTLERADGRWHLTTPIKARASAFAVDALLHLLHAPIEAPVGPATGDLARYGLHRPSLTLKFDGATIEFGQAHPLKDWQYVRYGENIYLISGSLYPHATRSYTGLIDSRLIEDGRKPVAFKLPGFALALKDGTWQRQPNDSAISSDRINAFVDEWRHAYALQVRPAGPGQAIKERIAITFETAGNAPSTLTLGIAARQPELVLVRMDEGLEYHFPQETGQRLLTLNAEEPK